MKILFIEATYKSTEPMSIMLLSAIAKARGHKTFLHVLEQGGLQDTLRDIRPDIVAYSAMTGDHRYFLKANGAVKEYDRKIFTIMGGRHPTFFPDVLEKSNLDAICIGEGDDAWPILLDVLAEGSSAETIPNILTKYNADQFSLFPRREDLDSLPFLDYGLCYKNHPFLGKSPKRTIMTSRGCPYNCTYCFNHIYNKMYKGKGPVVTRQSVDRVIAEADYMRTHWLTKFIKFYDDDFALTLDDWLYEFSEKWPEKIGLPFHCLLRADVVAKDPEILALLKKAGVVSVSMSVESGNDYIRNKLFNRRMSKEQLEKAFRTARCLGIHTFSNTILGVPISKEEEEKFALPAGVKRDIESVDFNIKIRATMTEYPILFPYPKTEIGEYCRRHGFFNADYETFAVSYQNQSPMGCFGKREKMTQQNLALLGTVIQTFAGSESGWVRRLTPLLRFLSVRLLIHLPLSKLYLLPYVMVLNYLHKTKLYAFEKFSFWEWLKAVPKSFFFNLKKQFEKPGE